MMICRFFVARIFRLRCKEKIVNYWFIIFCLSEFIVQYPGIHLYCILVLRQIKMRLIDLTEVKT